MIRKKFSQWFRYFQGYQARSSERAIGFEREVPSLWPERLSLPSVEAELLCGDFRGTEVSIPAHRLLTPYRFDIAAKYLYAMHREKSVASIFAEQVYSEHLRVWNGLHELDPVKHGLAAYQESFHEILDSIKTVGFDLQKSPVPVGRSLSPINGGHRIAACLLHGRDVSCRVVDEGLDTHNYNYLYFRNREAHVQGGLAPAFSNAIALEYCRLKRETYAVLVFPAATGRHLEIFDILLTHGHIAYEKEFFLGKAARLNLVRTVYAGEPWLGTEATAYNGANAKASLCFDGDGPLRLFIFETHDPEEAVRAKHEIRELFGIDKSSVHINDTHEETLRIVEALLNTNSLHFLENALPEPSARLLNYLETLDEWLAKYHLAREDLCIGGSAVLAAYGLRECKDLDFLHHFDLPEAGLPQDLGSHNEYAELYGISCDELIYNPANHFYLHGFKFASLPVLARMKKTRGERKDKVDLSLMKRAL